MASVNLSDMHQNDEAAHWSTHSAGDELMGGIDDNRTGGQMENEPHTVGSASTAGWTPEFENLITALVEDGKRQRREEEMRGHVRLLNEIYYAVHIPQVLIIPDPFVY